ncbi:YifB family Mg chelatase-like AAA ATPase [Burkholderia ubonensis]|uniref:YifB family Mg chelatase-like AAA ATPase n=1 Tax=Burkholderia ubonensis TaxID=101571 RepID=UPI0008FE8E75|nr:YifB family Mg chelatase-like AAA ATPase [Burkholderia ubonensis]OJA23939.1 magnesium chelatase [Burkholderia ubonensis]
MSLAVVRSRAPAAGRAPDVTVEVHLANGLPSFSIVGLPDLEVRESRERVRAALQNCGFEFPVRRITVNLAPADLPKESGRFDLPIALGILAALCAHLADAPDGRLAPVCAPQLDARPASAAPDLADVIGQRGARRALEVAAAGGHHMLMIGPPGAGKSMLAARLPGLLPPLTDDEALMSAALLSASRVGFSPAQWRQRPFRTPHHSSSAAALVGGRNPPQPGEITLAHLGVLFLDELPEFDRHVLEMLREPLEAGRITISRVAMQADFPAACQLIAAMNPCPCGWHGDPSGRCRCSPDVAARYLRKLSGPLLDRIDIQIDLPALTPAELSARASAPGEPSAAVAARVAQARALQLGRQGKTNHMLTGRETDDLCRPTDEGERLLREAGERFGWSARAYYRVLKVARTIADLAGDPLPTAAQIAEAIRYRRALTSL